MSPVSSKPPSTRKRMSKFCTSDSRHHGQSATGTSCVSHTDSTKETRSIWDPSPATIQSQKWTVLSVLKPISEDTLWKKLMKKPPKLPTCPMPILRGQSQPWLRTNCPRSRDRLQEESNRLWKRPASENVWRLICINEDTYFIKINSIFIFLSSNWTSLLNANHIQST